MAGLLQVSPDELVSALTTDIQYFKGKLYPPLIVHSVQFVAILEARRVNAASPFPTSGDCPHGLNAKRGKPYELICSRNYDSAL